MKQENKNILLRLLLQYKELDIADQIDYDKFYLDSIICYLRQLTEFGYLEAQGGNKNRTYILYLNNKHTSRGMKIEELRAKMCIPADASKDYIMKTFEDIADVLKNECVIKYGNEEYRILDFEFYFFNKNHQDISVHPRNSKALSWYVNEFGGIDLNFESNIEKEMVEKGKIWSFKYNLTDNSYYGGILIRQIQSLSDDKKIFNGPLKVAELFRILDATSQTQSNPVLVMKPLDRIAFIKSKRHNLLGSYKNKENKYKAKADYNIEEWFTNVSDSQKSVIEDKFASFVESEEYHFCYK